MISNQSSILALIDAELASILEQVIDRLFPPDPGIFQGARRRTQPLDIGMSAFLFIEKMLDQESAGAVG